MTATRPKPAIHNGDRGQHNVPANPARTQRLLGEHVTAALADVEYDPKTRLVALRAAADNARAALMQSENETREHTRFALDEFNEARRARDRFFDEHPELDQ